MNETGNRNPACGIDTARADDHRAVRYNFGAAALYEEAIRRGEARLTADGALVAETGQHTGRSPKDKFVVRDATTEHHVWWDNNKPMTPAQFDALLGRLPRPCRRTRDLFVQDLFGGADQRQQPADARHHRICLAFAVHPQPADPARPPPSSPASCPR